MATPAPAANAPRRRILPRKIIVWITFACHCLLSGAFIGLAITSGNNVYRNKDILTLNALKVYYNTIMANIVLGIVVVSLFLLIAPFILLNFLWVGGEYSYGFMMGMSFISSIFMLLVGSSLESADNVSSNLSPGQGWAGYTWGSTESNTFTSTYAFAYILCGSFIVMTFLLWLCRDVFAPHVIKKPVEIPVIVPTAAEVAAVGAPPGAIPVPVQGGTTVVFNPVAAPTPVSEVAPAVEAPPSATPARTGSPTLPPPPAENPFTTPGPSNV